MFNRFLITGSTGFTGRHLIDLLRFRPDAIVLGTGRRENTNRKLDGYLPGDLADKGSAAAIVRWARPDVVFHLAGLYGTADASQLWRANVDAYCRLLEALRRAPRQRKTRLIVVGSAAEFGSQASSRSSIAEDVACFPDTPYGRSKHEMVQLALAEPADSPVEIMVARLFNLLGPGLDERLAVGSFVRKLAAVLRGESDSIRCGSLEGRRDYVDVRDAMRACIDLADHGRRGELYHVCSGQSHRTGDLLELLIALGGRTVAVEAIAPSNVDDVSSVVGDYSKLQALTAWQPRVPIETSLREMLTDEEGIRRAA